MTGPYEAPPGHTPSIDPHGRALGIEPLTLYGIQGRFETRFLGFYRVPARKVRGERRAAMPSGWQQDRSRLHRRV